MLFLNESKQWKLTSHIERAIKETTKLDSDYCDELTLYADE
jgi:hypothetical protein